MDVLSEVLRVIQLTGAVYLDGRFSAPWSLLSRPDEAFCAAYLPPSDRVVSFHFVTEGECWAVLADDPASAVVLRAGEIVIVMQGEAHILGSSCDLEPKLAGPLLADQFRSAPGGVMTLQHGGGGAAAHIVCGFLSIQEAVKNPPARGAAAAFQS